MASVVAVCCALVWNTHWLCIPFGLSAIGAGYAIYLGYEYRNLQTFERSNEQLLLSLSVFKGENRRLSNQVEELKQANMQLQQSAQKFEKLLEESRAANTDHENLIKQLEKEIEELKAVRDQFLNKAQSHVQQLNELKKSLSGIHQSASGNHKVFGEQLNIFIEKLNQLDESEKGFTEACSEAERTMLAQTGALIETGNEIKETLEVIKKWKDKSQVAQHIDLLQNLHKQLLESTEKFVKTKKEIENLENQVVELEKTKIALDFAIDSLRGEIQRLGIGTNKLDDLTGKINQIIKDRVDDG
ncbi:MAG: hypothetical protein JJU12_01725 [Chlamydiales bacterium]|nr:hypothetical protein [Chlamydiales bacterium]